MATDVSARIRLNVAEGMSIILVQGWQVEAVGESGRSFEISMSKEQSLACLRLIALGNKSLDLGFDQFHFSLLESLDHLGCSIELPSTTKNLIKATHNDGRGKMIHFLRKSNPLLHLSANVPASPSHIEELVLMTNSISLDTSHFLSSEDREFGELVPLSLNEDLWTHS